MSGGNHAMGKPKNPWGTPASLRRDADRLEALDDDPDTIASLRAMADEMEAGIFDTPQSRFKPATIITPPGGPRIFRVHEDGTREEIARPEK